MIVSIGILAHNEASDIANLISDLGNQTLLKNENLKIEVHVVANGCTDATDQIARNALSAQSFIKNNITNHVHNLVEAGKSNAWNEFIHTFVSSETDFVFLLDADIRIPDESSLQLVLDRLIQSPAACVAVDDSVKDIRQEKRLSPIERLILAGSGTAYNTRLAIAGGLYCARYQVIKSIWMPIGLPGEDGFLRAMILTSNFSKDEDLNRLVFAEGARHIFESERTVRGVYRHNIRLAIGTAINVLLFLHIREIRRRQPDINLADYIRQRNTSDPKWINQLLAAEIASGKFFLLKINFLSKRLHRFSELSISEKLTKWPIYLVGLVFDVVLLISANRLMRRGAGAGFW